MTNRSDKRRLSQGRPRKLSERDERNIVGPIYKLRKETGSFTAKRVQEEAHGHHVTARSIFRCLHRHDYTYRQSRKKGLLTNRDKRIRAEFSRRALQFPKEKNEIAFYFDGIGFAHKSNPHGEARATGIMAWRKPNEGLSRTKKGGKEGSGGKMTHFHAGIAYDKGIVLCK